MAEFTARREKWELTGEALRRFLSTLDPDPNRAGEQYEAIRRTLVAFFDWQGAISPEDLSDETINRVVKKIEQGEALRDAAAYCHGVARLVLLEYRKATVTRRADLEDASTLPTPEVQETTDDRRERLQKCLAELTPENRELVLTYYKEEKQQKIDARAALALQLGIPLNALRSRVQRLRDRLEQCVRRAMTRQALRSK
jgi:RNA polymerase sigma factor (sigma-70 family)